MADSETHSLLANARTGDLLHNHSHILPVQSVELSDDGKQIASFTALSFTAWGIIKGHSYTGGIHAMRFASDGERLLVCGMGSTTDPAAGNGKRFWQRFTWRWNPTKKVGEAKDDEIGRGLMEAIAYHPATKYFAMAGGSSTASGTPPYSMRLAAGSRIHSTPRRGAPTPNSTPSDQDLPGGLSSIQAAVRRSPKQPCSARRPPSVG